MMRELAVRGCVSILKYIVALSWIQMEQHSDLYLHDRAIPLNSLESDSHTTHEAAGSPEAEHPALNNTRLMGPLFRLKSAP